LPEGTLVLCTDGKTWQLTASAGKKAYWGKGLFAVPITGQEAPTLHEPITREALNKALRERDEARAEARESLRDKFAMAAMSGCYAGEAPQKRSALDFEADAEMFYKIADAMLAARNQTV